MGQLGFQELILIFVVALLVFGPKKLPELGKSLGKGLREFKRATNDLKATWEEQVRDAESELSSAKKDLRNLERDLNREIRQNPPATPATTESAQPASSPPASDGQARPDPSAEPRPEKHSEKPS